jgi:hypothetical protein
MSGLATFPLKIPKAFEARALGGMRTGLAAAGVGTEREREVDFGIFSVEEGA